MVNQCKICDRIIKIEKALQNLDKLYIYGHVSKSYYECLKGNYETRKNELKWVLEV